MTWIWTKDLDKHFGQKKLDKNIWTVMTRWGEWAVRILQSHRRTVLFLYIFTYDGSEIYPSAAQEIVCTVQIQQHSPVGIRITDLHDFNCVKFKNVNECPKHYSQYPHHLSIRK